MMVFDELLLSINLLVQEMEDEPADAHELLEKIHLQLNQMKATGMPLPDDLVELERRLERDFSKPAAPKTK